MTTGGLEREPTGAASVARGPAWEAFLVALRLGLTSFGGPIAHLGYFHNEYVVRRRWVPEAVYADLVALSQFLPGPASSQLGIAIGTLRAGIPGGLLAWLGFTLPSALALTVFGLGLMAFTVDPQAGWLRGLLIAAVAVVAQAVWTMARSLAPDRQRATIAVAALVAVLVAPTAWTQIAVIVVCGVVGWIWLRPEVPSGTVREQLPVPRWFAVACLALFAGLLLWLPLARVSSGDQTIALTDVFYRAGALVFGGGHVVLPLLEVEVVPRWMTADVFLAGYGAAQAVPGPLFTFAAFLGAVVGPEPNGWAGATIALLAIFLPAFLLIWGVLPWWHVLRSQPVVRAALMGVNAGVVGILAAALYTPVFTAAVQRPVDAAVAAAGFVALMVWRVPPWVVVAACAVVSWGVSALSLVSGSG